MRANLSDYTGVTLPPPLPDDILRDIMDCAEPKAYTRLGRFTLRTLAIVKSGAITEISTDYDGNERTQHVNYPGMLLMPSLNASDYKAIQASTIGIVPHRYYEEGLLQRPEYLRWQIEYTNHLREEERLLAGLSAMNLNAGIRGLFLHMAQGKGAEPYNGKGVILRVPLPLTELASMLGSQRESIHRVFRALAREGVIINHVGRGIRSITVPDLGRLSANLH